MHIVQQERFVSVPSVAIRALAVLSVVASLFAVFAIAGNRAMAGEAVVADRQHPYAWVIRGADSLQPARIVADDYVIDVPSEFGYPMAYAAPLEDVVPGTVVVEFRTGALAWYSFTVFSATGEVPADGAVRVEHVAGANGVVLDVSCAEIPGDWERRVGRDEALSLFCLLVRMPSDADRVVTFEQTEAGTRIVTPCYAFTVPAEDGFFDCEYDMGDVHFVEYQGPSRSLKITFAGPRALPFVVLMLCSDGPMDNPGTVRLVTDVAIPTDLPSNPATLNVLVGYDGSWNDAPLTDDERAAARELAGSRAQAYAQLIEPLNSTQ